MYKATNYDHDQYNSNVAIKVVFTPLSLCLFALVQ